MFLFKIFAVTFIVFYTSYASENTENYNGSVTRKNTTTAQENVEKLKTEFNNISVNVENFAYGVIKQLMDVSKLFDKDDSTKTEKENSTTKDNYAVRIPENSMENEIEPTSTVKENLTTLKETISIPKENLTILKDNQLPLQILKNMETFSEKLLKHITRKKRSIYRESPNLQPSNVEPALSKPLENNEKEHTCPHKSEEQMELEKQQIEDLKQEINKLNDLVSLIRDQEGIMKILDHENDTMLNKNVSTKALVNVLDEFNTRGRSLNDDSIEGRSSNSTEDPKPIYEELENINTNLKHAVNETKNVIQLEKEKRSTIEKQLKKHGRELNVLKVMMEHFYIFANHKGNLTKRMNNTLNLNNTFTRLEDLLLNMDDDSIIYFDDIPTTNNTEMVGSMHLPKMLPSKEENTTVKEETQKPRDSEGNFEERSSKARASDSSDITKLIKMLDGSDNKKTDSGDFKSRILDLEQDLDEKKKEDTRMKQMIILHRLINSQQKQPDDSDITKRITQALIQKLTKPQGKIDDDEVENELSSLQSAINRLRPKEDGIFDGGQVKNEADQFQVMLNNLVRQEALKNQIGSAPNSGFPGQALQMTPQQIFELRKMMDLTGGFRDNGFPSGISSGYGFGTPNTASVYGQTPYSQYGSPAHYSPNSYSSYSKPYQSANVLDLMTYGGSSNAPQYNPQTSNYKSPNFGQNYRSPSPYNIKPVYPDQSPYQNSNPPNAAVPKPYLGPDSSNQYAPLPYSSNLGPNYPQNAANYVQNSPNQFFPMPQPQPTYDQPQNNNMYGPKNTNGPSLDQSAYNLPKGPQVADDYKVQKVEDLRKQIYNLENVISNLNKPDYPQKPEDKNTIANLEQKINDLKGVINNLNQPSYSEGQKTVPAQSYDQNSPQVPQAQGAQNYESSKTRRRRSIEEQKVKGTGNNIAENVTSFFKKFKRSVVDNKVDGKDSGVLGHVESLLNSFADEDDIKNDVHVKRSTYDDVKRKLEDLKKQRPNAAKFIWDTGKAF